MWKNFVIKRKRKRRITTAETLFMNFMGVHSIDDISIFDLVDIREVYPYIQDSNLLYTSENFKK